MSDEIKAEIVIGARSMTGGVLKGIGIVGRN